MISEIIEKWIKGILIDGITGNLSGLFDNVNAKVGEIASDVGSTPQAWNSGIFNMLRSLSETVVLPIAAAILALVMCHELIQMITEKNNMHDFDTSMFFRWIFKSAFAILIVSNTSLTQTSTQNIGKDIFTAMGVYRDARKDFVWQKDFPALSAILNGSKKKSLNTSSS